MNIAKLPKQGIILKPKNFCKYKLYSGTFSEPLNERIYSEAVEKGSLSSSQTTRKRFFRAEDSCGSLDS